ncbi:hypothetical protein LR48_Vigan316s000100 [Vigna angularis]|uniref:Uncharacterized protein n=1 Tax=Phaseolus angularis TaxID=3914 RepID=A0A0L9T9H8_PHAAN|nr:hypothetical protein LR48_Vigan316s000100 [Vigna angularis]
MVPHDARKRAINGCTTTTTTSVSLSQPTMSPRDHFIVVSSPLKIAFKLEHLIKLQGKLNGLFPTLSSGSNRNRVVSLGSNPKGRCITHYPEQFCLLEDDYCVTGFNIYDLIFMISANRLLDFRSFSNFIEIFNWAPPHSYNTFREVMVYVIIVKVYSFLQSGNAGSRLARPELILPFGLSVMAVRPQRIIGRSASMDSWPLGLNALSVVRPQWLGGLMLLPWTDHRPEYPACLDNRPEYILNSPPIGLDTASAVGLDIASAVGPLRLVFCDRSSAVGLLRSVFCGQPSAVGLLRHGALAGLVEDGAVAGCPLFHWIVTLGRLKMLDVASPISGAGREGSVIAGAASGILFTFVNVEVQPLHKCTTKIHSLWVI